MNSKRFEGNYTIPSWLIQPKEKLYNKCAAAQLGLSCEKRKCKAKAPPQHHDSSALCSFWKFEARAPVCHLVFVDVSLGHIGGAAEASEGTKWRCRVDLQLDQPTCSSPLKFPASSPIRAASWFENPHPHGQPANRLSNTQHASEKTLRVRTVLLRQIWLKLEPVLFIMAVT